MIAICLSFDINILLLNIRPKIKWCFFFYFIKNNKYVPTTENSETQEYIKKRKEKQPYITNSHPEAICVNMLLNHLPSNTLLKCIYKIWVLPTDFSLLLMSAKMIRRECILLSKLSKPRTKIINCDELCIEDLVTVNPERPTTENDIRDYQCL